MEVYLIGLVGPPTAKSAGPQFETLIVKATNDNKVSSGSPLRNVSSDRMLGNTITPLGSTKVNIHFQYQLND